MTLDFYKTMKALFALSTIVVCSSAFAETIETVEHKYYVISPRTPYDIKHELIRNTPIRDRGGSFNGHTDWYVDWNYRSTSTPYGCRLSQVQTKVHVVYTLPMLSEYVTDPQTIRVFNKFNAILTQHEKNHGNHGILAAREIDLGFKNIPPQQNCRYLSRYITDMGQSIVRTYIQKDRDYDRITNNGETEGAVIY